MVSHSYEWKVNVCNVFVSKHEIPNYCYRHSTHHTNIIITIIAILILIDLPLTEKFHNR